MIKSAIISTLIVSRIERENMRYFREIAFWKIITLNIIAGMAMSFPLMYAIVSCFGLFGPPPASERIYGIMIFVAIILFVIICNVVLWMFGKRIPAEDLKDDDEEQVFIRAFTTVVALILSPIGGFFISVIVFNIK